MSDPLEELIDSLLYEGYSLYPYTPGATKNSTPTPFGIVYPPSYAAALSSTFDHLELRCLIESPPAATLDAEVRFLICSGERNTAAAQRIALAPTTLGGLAAAAHGHELEQLVDGRLAVTTRLTARPLGDGRHELSLRVENRSGGGEDLDRAGALRSALISTHPVLRVSAGRFISSLEHPCPSTNTFPVLADADDRAVLGAAIVLPDHPQIAAESLGGLFDSTEIEEALLLHVQVLSDAERREIERDDPVVSEMIARAARATPEQILALHGRVTVADPPAAPARSRVTLVPPSEPAGLADPTLGEAQAEVDGVRFLRGTKVRIRPGPDADLHARMLDGRVATVERIMIDYDGKVHLGVTIDGDPGQELLRDSGRLLYFFAPEVEVLR